MKKLSLYFFGLFALLLMAGNPLAHGATLLVTQMGDAGPGSLRQAILDANGGDTIQFASGLSGSIPLATSLSLSVPINMVGPGAEVIQINGNGLPALQNIMTLQPGADGTNISGLAFTAGVNDGIFSQADFNLSEVTLSGNGGLGLNIESAEVLISDSLITGNQNGGIFAEINSELTLTNTSLSMNQRNGNGGGITLSDSTANLSSTTLSGNGTQGDGGGIALMNSNLVAENLTLSGNTAVGDGGGLFADGTSLAMLSNSTVTLNQADQGGGLASGIVEWLNTLVADNQATTSSPDCLGSFDSLGGNLIGNNEGCTLMNVMSDDQQGTPGNPIDALLGPLADSGGTVMTHSLLLGSPAVDQGTNTDCPSSDARGTTRPLNGLGNGAQPQCDVGASEVGRSQLQFISQGFNNIKLQTVDPQLPTTLNGQLNNIGPDYAPGVAITGTLPDGVQLLGATVSSGSCTLSQNLFNCAVGNLEVGVAVNFSLQVQVSSGNQATYLVQALATTTGEDLGNQNTLNILLSVGAPEQPTGGGCRLGQVPHSNNQAFFLVILLGVWASLRFARSR